SGGPIPVVIFSSFDDGAARLNNSYEPSSTLTTLLGQKSRQIRNFLKLRSRESAAGPEGFRSLVRTTTPAVPFCLANLHDRLNIHEFFCTIQCPPADLSLAQSCLAFSTVSIGPICAR